MTPIEQKLVDDLAHQAGLVLKNVGLSADLQARLDELRASRQRWWPRRTSSAVGWNATSTTARSNTWWRSR